MPASTLTDSELWKAIVWIVMALGLGQLGRAMLDCGPIDWRRFGGEFLISMILAVTLFALGQLQGLDFWQLVFVGGLAGIGGVKTIEWGLAIVKTMQVRK